MSLIALAAATLGALLPETARAAYPGQNGVIAYAQSKYDKRAAETGFFGRGALFTVSPDGTGVIALPDMAKNDDYEPAFSPDGTQLASASVGTPKTTGIYAGPVGSTSRKLVVKADFPDAPAWAPNGTTLAYVDYAKGLYVLDTSTTAKPQLLVRNTKKFSPSAPAYSADGTLLFHTRQYVPGPDTTDLTSEIWATDQTGANPRKVIGDGGELSNVGEADVSPDSKQLVFAQYTVGKRPGGVWVSAVDGSGARKLVGPPRGAFYTGPAWSPDGTKIVASLIYGSIKKGSALVLIDPTSGATKILRKAKKTYMGTAGWQAVPATTPAN